MTGQSTEIEEPAAPSERGPTSFAAWAPLLADARPWTPPEVPTVVVVPHPDDEVLSTGGLIATQRRRGVPVTVLAVTDGEHAYPDAVPPARLGALRRTEQQRALAQLGVAASDTRRLGLPDSGVAAHLDQLVQSIADLVTPDTLLVAPWERDFHADHEACGRAAAQVAGDVGVLLVQGLFWAYHRRDPAEVPADRLHALPLAPAVRRMRARALDAHASQVTDRFVTKPMLGPVDLLPAQGPDEHLLLDDPRSARVPGSQPARTPGIDVS